MGGFGSGLRATRKCTVEESWRLRIGDVVEALARASDRFDHAVVAARNADRGDLWVHAGQDHSESTVELGIQLAISYRPPGVWWLVEDTVHLTFTRPWFGGKRWWLACPCGRRAVALYLPPDATYFRCRDCNGLTYQSVQSHDARVSFLRRHPEKALALLRSSNPKTSGLFLVLKALRCLDPPKRGQRFSPPNAR